MRRRKFPRLSLRRLCCVPGATIVSGLPTDYALSGNSAKGLMRLRLRLLKSGTTVNYNSGWKNTYNPNSNGVFIMSKEAFDPTVTQM